jgi:hypothetical protein
MVFCSTHQFDGTSKTSQIMRDISRYYNHLRYFAAAVFGIWGLYSLSTGNTDAAKILIFIALIGLSSSLFFRSRFRNDELK